MAKSRRSGKLRWLVGKNQSGEPPSTRITSARFSIAMGDSWQVGQAGSGVDRSNPNAVALFYLGWLQEELLSALIGT
jgi:hypothetical protein